MDWSEVFHVANGSPIEPGTVLGAQMVFAMRATLDLLMIAAVVQAVQLASRLTEQNTAFAAGKIDILEPFVERTRLHALGAALDRVGEGAILAQQALTDFPAYSPKRLEQIASPYDNSPKVQAKADPRGRRAALALVARQFAPEEALGLIGRAHTDDDEVNRQFATRLRHELEWPQAVLVRAYKMARDGKPPGGGVDTESLLGEFKDYERPLALRAMRTAFGELDQMVRIPAGEFVMGAPEGEQGSIDSERPQHEVRVAAFEIGKHPVTFEEFGAFCDATGYYRRAVGSEWPTDMGGRGRHPVISVGWYDAQAYIAWLNSWTGSRFRLPSEAEWEYACRAGTTTRWSFGDDEEQLGEHAWFAGNSGVMTHPVGEKLPNAFGLHDMHGSVWEWCEDAWHETYEGAPEDGSVWTGGETTFRVFRGGSWGDGPERLRSAQRFGNNPAVRVVFNGFRLARSASGD